MRDELLYMYSTVIFDVFRIGSIYGSILQIYNFTLTLGASPVPSSSRVIVYGNDAYTWTVYINKTCSDNFYHWTSDKELTNCVTYVERIFKNFGTAVFKVGIHTTRVHGPST